MGSHVVKGLVCLVVALVCGCERAGSEQRRDNTYEPGVESPAEQDGSSLESSMTSSSGRGEYQTGEFIEIVAHKRDPIELELLSASVGEAPVIDGVADDSVWSEAVEIITLDRSTQQEISIRSVHTGDEIMMLVSYEDQAASETHKTWVWDENDGIYKQGFDREDMFVFKWSMEGLDANLSIYRDPRPHLADIWFWKACRTNPMGVADDKSQHLVDTERAKASKVTTADGGLLYLTRSGDDGVSSYGEDIPVDYKGEKVPKFLPRKPEGSRGDIRAKGRWDDGRWTIEFARRLDTGHTQDIAFEIGGSYLFGVSRYEMSNVPPNPQWAQPLYRTGDVFDRIILQIAE